MPLPDNILLTKSLNILLLKHWTLELNVSALKYQYQGRHCNFFSQTIVIISSFCNFLLQKNYLSLLVSKTLNRKMSWDRRTLNNLWQGNYWKVELQRHWWERGLQIWHSPVKPPRVGHDVKGGAVIQWVAQRDQALRYYCETSTVLLDYFCSIDQHREPLHVSGICYMFLEERI